MMTVGSDLKKGPIGRLLAGFLAVVAYGLIAAAAKAETYPTKQIRIIVPFNPGAAVDIAARLFGRALEARTGQTVIVENRTGGASVIGSEVVARSSADGHTLLFTTDDTFDVLPFVSRNLTFSPSKELVVLREVGKIVNVMIANSAVPFTDLPGLIAYARANPFKLSYATPGSGTGAQLAMEALKSAADVKMTHVPFRGNAPALEGVVGNQVQLGMIGFGSARGFIEAGRLRSIVIAGSDREPMIPQVATTSELGFPDVDVTTRLVLAVSAKVPSDLLRGIDEAVARIMDDQNVRQQFEARNITVTNLNRQGILEILSHRSEVNKRIVRIAEVTME